MREAPPISLSVGGGAVWRGLRFGLPALAAAVTAGWALDHLGWPTAGAVLGLSIALLGGVAVWRLPVVAAELSFDGRHWSVDSRVGALDVMIDLQHWLLLRLRPDDGSPARWVAVAGAEAGARMPLLRALVHSGPAGGGDRAAGRAGAGPAPSDR